MFHMWSFDRSSGSSKMTRDVPNIRIRLDVLALTVASELDALGYIYPGETPMSVMYEMVDMAVARHFPGMDEIGGNDRYVRKVVRYVGSRAFSMIESGNVVSPDFGDSILVPGSF